MLAELELVATIGTSSSNALFAHTRQASAALVKYRVEWTEMES